MEPPTRSFSLTQVSTQAALAPTMVNSMLAISEMESGVARLDAQPVDCAALVAETCELFEPATEDRGIKLNVEAAGPAHVLGDRGRLQQALSNLDCVFSRHTNTQQDGDQFGIGQCLRPKRGQPLARAV